MKVTRRSVKYVTKNIGKNIAKFTIGNLPRVVGVF